MEIKAISGNHILLCDKGKPMVIGNINTTAQGDVTVSKVVFHFGTEYQDLLVFKNDKLTDYKPSHKTPGYVKEIYLKCTEGSLMTKSELIEQVVDAFTFVELGF